MSCVTQGEEENSPIGGEGERGQSSAPQHQTPHLNETQSFSLIKVAPACVCLRELQSVEAERNSTLVLELQSVTEHTDQRRSTRSRVVDFFFLHLLI